MIADAATQAARKAVCAKCPHATGPAGRKVFCGRCGCVLVGKTKLKGATCPEGKW